MNTKSEREAFNDAMADECPEFQRTTYTADDVYLNVRTVARSMWLAGIAFARASSPNAAGAEWAKPVAWVRYRSDGGFEGPIMDTDERMCDVRRTSGAWTPLYDRRAPAAIPAGWMLVPKHRGTKPLAELIIAASLACVENRLMDDDDRHEFAQFADQLQHAPPPPAPASAPVGLRIPIIEELAQDSRDFKNFHRQLCERFGYVHDEDHWRRDQLSLIEWIASGKPEPRDEVTDDLVVLRNALISINGIRNSIIGLHTLNWSEHVYPLVAALDAAGFEGMGYPEARAFYGTMLDRCNAAEKDAERYRLLRRGQIWSVLNGIGDMLRADELDAAIDAARAGEAS
ncbi:hypothetical protein KDX40_04705 [Burkholderia ambifaria]|uniref:hypothetical protein n=1 Tax=Burkholderia ambifaria TaxID=152480 RepID=UPI001B8DE080|nr:hypothetical protein [Burkholderia ambifaria]MBR8343038.1 hypothetical protein [Burkholderia ambifaria]